MADVIEIKGAKQLETELHEMGRKAASEYVVGALKDGGKVLQDAMVAKAPEKTGKLKKAIRVRTGKRGNGQWSVKVGLPKSKIKGSGAYYGAFEDEGWFTGKRLANQHFGSKTESARDDYHKKSLAAGRKFHEGKHFVEQGGEQAMPQAEQIVKSKLEAIVSK